MSTRLRLFLSLLFSSSASESSARRRLREEQPCGPLHVGQRRISTPLYHASGLALPDPSVGRDVLARRLRVDRGADALDRDAQVLLGDRAVVERAARGEAEQAVEQREARRVHLDAVGGDQEREPEQVVGVREDALGDAVEARAWRARCPPRRARGGSARARARAGAPCSPCGSPPVRPRGSGRPSAARRAARRARRARRGRRRRRRIRRAPRRRRAERSAGSRGARGSRRARARAARRSRRRACAARAARARRRRRADRPRTRRRPMRTSRPRQHASADFRRICYPLDRGDVRRYARMGVRPCADPRRPGREAPPRHDATAHSASSATTETAAPSSTPGGVNVHVTRFAPAGTSTARRSPASARARRGRRSRPSSRGRRGRRRRGARGRAARSRCDRDLASDTRAACGALPGRTMRANGSAAVVARDHAQAVSVDDWQTPRRLARRRDVVAHCERAQLRRRVAQRELEVPVDRAPAVRGEHQTVVALEVHRVVARHILEPEPQRLLVEQQGARIL